MSDVQNIIARIKNKSDTTKNWNKSTMIPLAGEIIVYSDSKPYPNRIKIGDGVTLPKDLPFAAAEVEDGRIDFEGNEHETLGDAIRAQGVKIEIDDSEALGENILNQDAWRALNEGKIVSKDNGVIVVSHDACYGDYFEQIRESEIEPHVGYYLNGDFDELVDEDDTEAPYLTDADVASASYVKGATIECDYSRVTPAALLVLRRGATKLGRVDVICRYRNGQPESVPTDFDIQVKTLAGTWKTVVSREPRDGSFIAGKTYQTFIFDSVVCTAVRVLVHDTNDNSYPRICEITLYEVKSGRLLERVKPTSYDTRAKLYEGGSGPLENCQDGDRTTYYQAFKFTETDEENPNSEFEEYTQSSLVPMTKLTGEFGYYTNSAKGEITPHYASNSNYNNIANLGDGNSSTQVRSDYYLHSDIASGAKIPVIFFKLTKNSWHTLGGIKIEGYEYQRYNIEDFEVQVHTPNEDMTSIQWVTVATVTNAFRDGEHGEDVAPLMINFETPVSCDQVRILVKRISDMSAEAGESAEDAELLEGGYIRIKEITLYEAKEIRQDNPIPFEFRFDKKVVVSKFRIFAYKKDNYTPKSIFMTAKVDGEWVDIFGSAHPPKDGTGKYVAEEIYPEGFTDTFVHELDKDYEVSAVRLYVTDRVGLKEDGETPKYGQLILNEIEFYGPASAVGKETSIGVAYDGYDADLTQKAGDVWYFGAKVLGEKYEHRSSLNRPEIVLEADVNGEHKELCSSMTVSESLEDYYCTFTIPKDYEGPFGNILVKVRYPNSTHLQGKTCKFSDFALVNLTEAYGAGNEPVADDYCKALRTSTMTVHRQEGSVEFKSVTGPRSTASKTAYEYAVSAGFNGTEEEFAKQLYSKVEVDSYYKTGKNVLKEDKWVGIENCKAVNNNGIIVATTNGYYGDYLEQIRESTITPHVGYYMDGELVDEVPEMAVYLTDAAYEKASHIKGSADCDLSTMTPTVVLDLSAPTLIGGVELTCRMDAGIGQQAPTVFDIQVKDVYDNWRIVQRVTSDPFSNNKGTVKYTFNPIYGTAVRIFIHECLGSFPVLHEICLYEVKRGRVIEKVSPIDIHTTANPAIATAIDAIIDDDKYSNFQTFDSVPVITFDFANFGEEPATISRMKICAYGSKTYSPRNIIVEALVGENEWVNVYGKAPAYNNGFRDTFVLDFDKEYDVYSIRLSITSKIGNGTTDNLLVLNEVEFYGPSQTPGSLTREVGIVYNDYDENITLKEDDIWYFGAKVACNTASDPRVFIEGCFNDDSSSGLIFDYAEDNSFKDYYTTFEVSENYSGSFTDLKIYARYDYDVPQGVSCQFTEMVLVNLTEIFGKDKEPSAEEYYKDSKDLRISVFSNDGVKRFCLGGKVTSVNGHTGDVNLNASNVGAAPSGYGWGETSAKYLSNLNLNTLRTTGLYDIYRPTNAPHSSTNYWTVLVLTQDLSKTYQIAFNNTERWIRYSTSSSSSSWSTWKDANKGLPFEYGWGNTEANILSYKNLNAIRTTGLYSIAYSLAYTTNVPYDNKDYWTVLVLAHGPSHTYQIAFDNTSGESFIRHSVSSGTASSSWTKWKASGIGAGWGDYIAASIKGNDLNNAYDTGLYRVDKNTINSPDSSCVVVFTKAVGDCISIQTAYDADGRNIAVRSSAEGQVLRDDGFYYPGYVWNDWVSADSILEETINTAELITIDDIDEIWGGAPATPAATNSISE